MQQSELNARHEEYTSYSDPVVATDIDTFEHGPPGGSFRASRLSQGCRLHRLSLKLSSPGKGHGQEAA